MDALQGSQLICFHQISRFSLLGFSVCLHKVDGAFGFKQMHATPSFSFLLGSTKSFSVALDT